jgi:flagella synthesis protein FlgN
MNLSVAKPLLAFEQDQQLMNALLKLLEREQATLIKLDVEGLEVMLEDKNQLLLRIKTAANNRYSTLQTHGFEGSEAGMLAWLQQQNKPSLNQSWAVFQKTINLAKEMNRLNGMLINKHFSRNQQLLSHLQNSVSNASVYGRDGQSKTTALQYATTEA